MGKDLTVAADGGGDFPTLQAAIDSLPAGGTERVTMHIKPGVYRQGVVIAKTAPPIALRGEGAKPADVVLTYDLSANSTIPPSTQPVGTSGSASTKVHSNDFSAENVTFENSAGEVGQAVAIRVMGDRSIFRNCRFLGWQDTLYLHTGRAYFSDCYIEGRVDFIFGRAAAWFEHCTIHSKNGGYVTAANTAAEQPFGFVFHECTLTGEGKQAFLGRPWQWDRGPKASVTFIDCMMGDHILPEGWNPWDLKDKKNEHPEETTRYAEHGSKDAQGAPLDVSKRVKWAKQLSADEASAITVETVLAGSDGWNPAK